MNKPQNLKGFRDFLPKEKRKRDWVQKKIAETFELFGFEPLETPTLEYASLLLGKYGDEADQLVYTFEDKGNRKIGLRYDQTVPTARILGQYQNELPKFFKRYQIQNVFRADKPQKGRYREFTQCDIDIFGSNQTINDAEILACTYAAYQNIGFKKITIQINDRKVLINTLTPFTNKQASVTSIIQTIDKLDKLDESKVINELKQKGVSNPDQVISTIKSAEVSKELIEITNQATSLGVNESCLQFSPTLARGLDYYTGMIFEVLIDGYPVGSVGGGGRYDKLINELTGQEIEAVGMAFGFDRTVEAATTMNLIPDVQSAAQVLVTQFDEKYTDNSLKIVKTLRQNNISTEIYPRVDKLGKQFKLANQKNIPYVIVVGEEEVKNQVVTLKNMDTGAQETLTLDQIINLREWSST